MEPTLSPPSPKNKIPTWIKVLLILFVLFVGFFLLLGTCLGLLGHFMTTKGGQAMMEKGLEKVIEKGLETKDGKKPDLDLEINKEGMEIKDKGTGEVFNLQVGQGVPDGFPKDVPVYAPATVLNSMVLGPAKMLNLETPSDFNAVSEFYKTKLPSEGWKLVTAMNVTETDSMNIYQKGDSQLTVTVTKQEGKTAIGLMTGTGK